MTMAPLEVAARADRVRSRFDALGIDALVVTDLDNVRWLTGFTGSNGVAVMTADGTLVLITDGRYQDQAAAELTAAGVRADLRIGRTGAEMDRWLADGVGGSARLGLEAEHVSWSSQQRYASGPLADRSLIPTAGVIEAERAVKDPGEVARIEEACRIADQALATIRARFVDQPTEREFARELESEMNRLGSDGPSFPTIVASGPNSALPHHRADDRTVAEGDLVVVDFGALFDGYHSDMTRTFVVGEPSPEQSRMIRVVTEAQQAGAAAVGPGVATRAIDQACRDHITAAGWGDRFTHGTGHGVGLQIHEAPWIGSTSDGVLVAGNVVTVEPGVYVPGLGGVRVEDSVLVTEHGGRPLTLHPKDSRCLPSPPMI
ncbi:MAG: Xaa-Pro aminopeptidase [Acidimicrobiia bacterium]|nr:Xaa-Pro aminopeptidase [Acidimicrobiia bacterium]